MDLDDLDFDPIDWGALLNQDQVWTRGQRLDQLDPHHRANLIPFLRGNVRSLKTWAPDDPRDPEDWLADTPLMRRLCEMEAGRSLDDRRATSERNQAHERATGYRKVRHG